jgi:hypothetical protein
MFLYHGGEIVRKGLYWNPACGKRVVMKDSGVLPGDLGYLRLPHSLMFLVLPAVGLVMSVALPFGMGFAFFVTLLVVAALAWAIGFTIVTLLKLLAGAGASLGFAPTAAFLAGAKLKPKRI